MPDRHFEWPDLPIPPRWALQGRYLVEDVLGAGPHGTVVGARDCEAGRPVAVKILRAGFELLDDQLSELRRERGALPIGEAVDHVLAACGALAEAHRAGLTHGNLKHTSLFLARPALGPPLARVLDSVCAA